MSTVCMHMESQIKKLSTNSDQKEDKSFCLTDKPLTALYMALGYLDGQCTCFLVLKLGRKYRSFSLLGASRL